MKNTTIALLLSVSLSSFAQQFAQNKDVNTQEIPLSYLDSLKTTFVKDNMALCVDSLWMNELTNLDLYNEITTDIENVDLDKKVDYDLPTSLLKSRLKAMNAKSPFRIEYNESLENVIKSYLKYRKKSFGRLMGLSQYYFPIFEEAFAKENVPLEIKYLAIVESALNPKAVSRMGATGLWQFMYQTGKQYDLNIDSYVDERSDPLKATAAAAQYMSRMYKIFGDWELVLASYNSGPGNVSKAIRRSGGKQNYWNIRKKLPKETQGYVPAFLATMYLYEYHKEHGIVPDEAVMQHFATDTVMVRKQLSFKQISDLLDVPVSQLQVLNPSYKLNVIPHYNDKNHYLRLPNAKIAVFVSNEEKIYAYADYLQDLKEHPYNRSRLSTNSSSSSKSGKRVVERNTKYYKIRRGDNLGSIAKKYHVTITNLKKWNNLRSNKIASGKRLKIITTSISYQKTEPKEVNNQLVAKNNDILAVSEMVNTNYTVQKGDVLGTIASKFNTSVTDLKKWNNLKNNTIAQGSRLIVAQKQTAVTDTIQTKATLKENTAANQLTYSVKRGDSLYSIARKYPGVSITDLKKWNNIKGESIKPGMKLKIRS
ncbi:membrane-bound lytic murein transglycosylase D [Flavobacterium sp. 28A]|nr:LysM peptidoglycan-binding domain-containing protein [Flavobacterium sp. 28A]NRT14511.1 membrane-bound lytic murein transglycosylase D [Flavobacterium sp. 28A]